MKYPIGTLVSFYSDKDLIMGIIISYESNRNDRPYSILWTTGLQNVPFLAKGFSEEQITNEYKILFLAK